MSGTDREAEVRPDIELRGGPSGTRTHARRLARTRRSAAHTVPTSCPSSFLSAFIFVPRDTEQIRVSGAHARIAFPAIPRDRYRRCPKVIVDPRVTVEKVNRGVYIVGMTSRRHNLLCRSTGGSYVDHTILSLSSNEVSTEIRSSIEFYFVIFFLFFFFFFTINQILARLPLLWETVSFLKNK